MPRQAIPGLLGDGSGKTRFPASFIFAGAAENGGNSLYRTALTLRVTA
jgi:hypothetical protein